MEINGGIITRNETNEKSMGGTELMTLGLYERIDKELLKDFQIISSRIRSELDETKIRIFWAHDLPQDPECRFMADKNTLEKFHKYIFASHWQMQQFINMFGIPWSKCFVLKNAIDPIPVHEKPKDQINLIYFSTPHRGLDILTAVFEKISKEYDNVFLDVFSSFKLYGWENRDDQYEYIFDILNKNPKVRNHGTVDNNTIREALTNSHILAYPCTWPETSCLTLMESMSGRLTCVHSDYAALPETASNFTIMYHYNEILEQHMKSFYIVLKQIIETYSKDPNFFEINNKTAKMYADSFYSWKNRIKEWENLLIGLKETIKDRSFPEPVFSYKTC